MAALKTRRSWENFAGTTDLRQLIHASGRYMWVEFDSDRTSNDKGFLASYTAVAVRPQCNPNAVPLTGSSGSFSSPNYPSDYPNSETCRWIISVPQGYIVRLEFPTFILESCVVSCSCDHVTIRDGTTENSPKLGEFCGNNRPPSVYSSGRYMWVEFDSDRTFNDKGFLASYSAVVSTTKDTMVSQQLTLGIGAIVGIVLGCGIGFFCMVVCIYVCCKTFS
ncbi:tolloid-like protein 2 [Montipora foliosa]|uniref:tolloid-like protein 2 n=1 Tax=Montipora foliosa TaxID=591990 RepID=UPI0035F1FAFB